MPHQALGQDRWHDHQAAPPHQRRHRHRLTNARVEAANTRIRPIARRAYGFHSAEALIALAMLSLGGLAPDLPGRS
jgi:hypothetical protein